MPNLHLTRRAIDDIPFSQRPAASPSAGLMCLRKKSLALLGEMAEGRNPNEEKKKGVGTKVSLADAFDGFFLARPTSRLIRC